MLNILMAVGGFILRLVGNALLKLLTEKMVIAIVFWCLGKLAQHTKSTVDDDFVALVKAEYEKTQQGGGE